MIPLAEQLIAVISWLVVLHLLQLAICPQLRRIFKNLAYPVSFTASLLLFTAISWYCGVAQLPILLTLIPFFILLVWNLHKKEYTRSFFSENVKWELLFLISFLFLLEIRFVNPTISFAEKFMDHAFLASIIRNPVIPPVDPWFAGGYLNVYYYLGYWIFGCLSIVTNVPSYISFNLALPTVFSLAVLNIVALATLMVQRYRLLLVLPLLIVNPSFIYQALAGKGVSAIIWDSTRTISGTINEYPIFSFVWGDVHAHVVGIFNQLFFLFILIFAYMKWGSLSLKERGGLIILGALSLGAMPLINTWDVLIYGPVTLLFATLIWWKSHRSGRPDYSPLWIFMGLPILAVILYLPFYLQMKTAGIEGVFLVHTPTEPTEFLLVHGFFLIVFYLFIVRDIVKRPYFLLIAVPFLVTGYYSAAITVVPIVYILAKKTLKPEELLAILGLAIVVFCEILYLKDNMGDTYFRMNTVFKFYIAAWLIMGVSAFALVADWLGTRNIPRVLQARSREILAISVIVLLILPFAVPIGFGYSGNTLNGLDYLESSHPGDAAAAQYLRSLPDTFCMAEAVDGDYTYYSRMSSFTGIPTILGMPFHEYMWRGDSGNWFGQRKSDLRDLYENPNQTVSLLEKYNCTYLVVGDTEREHYNVSIPLNNLDLVFSKDTTQVYRIR
ncbi:MAG: DUF2298 domain-containing protein [Methanoregulaceae archaeon]